MEIPKYKEWDSEADIIQAIKDEIEFRQEYENKDGFVNVRVWRHISTCNEKIVLVDVSADQYLNNFPDKWKDLPVYTRVMLPDPWIKLLDS